MLNWKGLLVLLIIIIITIIIIIIIIISGARVSPLGTAAITGLLYQHQMIVEIGRKNRSTWRKRAPVPNWKGCRHNLILRTIRAFLGLCEEKREKPQPR
jgi:hypothetical protein